MTEPQAVYWKKEETPSNSRVALGIWGGIILSTLALVFLTAHFSEKQKESSKVPEKVVTKEVHSAIPPSFEGAKTIFVVAVRPSEKLLKDLEIAHQNGTKVQLITTEKIEVPYSIALVAPQNITRNAVLINGSSWYQLEP